MVREEVAVEDWETIEHVEKVKVEQSEMECVIDQFSNLEGIAGRILGCYEHGPTFFVREILDGIAAKPGGDYIHGGYRHRQALQQSRVKYHGLPGPPLVRADHES